MSNFEVALQQLPKPILRKLRSIIWRVRRLLFVRGIFATLAVALVCLLAIMAIDASITIFSTKVRWLMSLSGVAITLLAGWWFLFRPLSRKYSLTQVARILEVRHPELQERISTAVELLSSDDPEEIKGSEELIKEVVDSAVVDVEKVDPRREFKAGKAFKFVGIAAACIGLLAIVLFAFPDQGFILLKRAVAPFLNIGNAYADTIQVEPGNRRVAKGSEVTIEMTVKHDRLKRAELRRTLDDGSESVERMTLMGKTDDGAQRFSVTFPSVDDSFQYRVRAGVGVSEFYQIESVPAPVVENMKVRYDYPEYTGVEPLEIDDFKGEIRAVAHTKVTVTSTVNKEIYSAKTLLNDSEELGETNVEDKLAINSFSLKPNTNGTWRLDLVDTDEFENVKVPYTVQALPDKVPLIRITNPTLRELTLKPVEVLPISFEVNEDFGFSEVAMLVTASGESSPRVITQPMPTRDGQPGVWRGRASLNLASLELKNNQRRLQVQVRVRDSRPEEYKGPGEAISETIIILINTNAKSLAEQTIDTHRQELEKAIREARNDLNRARADIKAAERELGRNDEISKNAERQIKMFEEQAEKATEKLEAVAEKLKDSVFSKQAEALAAIVDDHVAEAREEVELIPVTDDRRDRVKLAKEAEDNIEEALEELRDVEKSIGDSKDDLEAITQLNEMANEQRELALDAQEQALKDEQRQQQMEMASNERLREKIEQDQQKALQEFQDRQEDIQEELGDLLKENAAALQEALEPQKEQAESLAEQAEDLAKRQQELREMTQDAASRQDEADQQEELREALINELQEMQQEIAKETEQIQQEIAQQQQSESQQQQSESQQQQSESQQQQSESQQQQSESQQQQSESQQQQSESQQQQSESQQQQSESQEQQSESQPQQSENQQQQSESQQQQSESQQQQSESQQMQPEGEPNSESQSATEPETSALEQAAEQTQQSAENLAEENVQDASAAAQEAAESLAQAAKEMAAEAEASDMSDGSDMSDQSGEAESTESEDMAAAEALAELAERQEALAEQIAAVESGNLQEALEMMEQQLAEDATDLAQQAENLEQTLENLDQKKSRYEAGHASNFLENASNQAEQASNQLEDAGEAQQRAEQSGEAQQGEMARQAAQSMRRSQAQQQIAQRSLETASNSLAKSAQQIGQTMEGLKPSEDDNRLADSQQMAESFNELTESAQSQNAQQAAQNAQQAANSLQELAQQAMAQLGQVGQPQPGQNGQPGQQQAQPGQQMSQSEPGSQPNDGRKTADAFSDAVPPELQELGISAKDWARFKGALTGGNATAIDTNLPAEYRELVGRYFQVIAKEADGK